MTHLCVSKLAIIVSDNDLSPGRRQAIIWNNAGILSIGILGTNFSQIPGKIHSFSFKKMHFKMSSAKGRLFSLSLNELTLHPLNCYPENTIRAIHSDLVFVIAGHVKGTGIWNSSSWKTKDDPFIFHGWRSQGDTKRSSVNVDQVLPEYFRFITRLCFYQTGSA